MDIFTKIYFTCKISSLFIQTGSAEKVYILLQTRDGSVGPVSRYRKHFSEIP